MYMLGYLQVLACNPAARFSTRSALALLAQIRRRTELRSSTMLALLGCSVALHGRAVMTGLPSARAPLHISMNADVLKEGDVFTKAEESVSPKRFAVEGLDGKVVPTKSTSSPDMLQPLSTFHELKGASERYIRHGDYPYWPQTSTTDFVYGGSNHEALGETIRCLLLVPVLRGDGNGVDKATLAGGGPVEAMERAFVYTTGQASLGKAFGGVTVRSGGEGSTAALAGGGPVEAMERAFVYTTGQASLSKAFGGVTVLSGGEGGGIAATTTLHYPYLTRRTEAEFVYGQHEALGAMLGCVLPLADVLRANVLLTAIESTAELPMAAINPVSKVKPSKVAKTASKDVGAGLA